MNSSKILVFPTFKPIPKTQLANVQENIENWKKRGCTDMLETFCRPDCSIPSGYRFVTCSDLVESITTTQTIKKIPFEITYTRRLQTKDRLCPLYFSEYHTEIILKHDEFTFEFKSDNHLNKMIKIIKTK